MKKILLITAMLAFLTSASFAGEQKTKHHKHHKHAKHHMKHHHKMKSKVKTK